MRSRCPMHRVIRLQFDPQAGVFPGLGTMFMVALLFWVARRSTVGLLVDADGGRLSTEDGGLAIAAPTEDLLGAGPPQPSEGAWPAPGAGGGPPALAPPRGGGLPGSCPGGPRVPTAEVGRVPVADVGCLPAAGGKRPPMPMVAPGRLAGTCSDAPASVLSNAHNSLPNSDRPAVDMLKSPRLGGPPASIGAPRAACSSWLSSPRLGQRSVPPSCDRCEEESDRRIDSGGVLGFSCSGTWNEVPIFEPARDKRSILLPSSHGRWPPSFATANISDDGLREGRRGVTSGSGYCARRPAIVCVAFSSRVSNWPRSPSRGDVPLSMVSFSTLSLSELRRGNTVHTAGPRMLCSSKAVHTQAEAAAITALAFVRNVISASQGRLRFAAARQAERRRTALVAASALLSASTRNL